MPTQEFKPQLTNVFLASINWMLLPASNYFQACSNQIIEHSSDNETVFSGSQKLGGAADRLIDLDLDLLPVSFEF